MGSRNIPVMPILPSLNQHKPRILLHGPLNLDPLMLTILNYSYKTTFFASMFLDLTLYRFKPAKGIDEG